MFRLAWANASPQFVYHQVWQRVCCCCYGVAAWQWCQSHSKWNLQHAQPGIVLLTKWASLTFSKCWVQIIEKLSVKAPSGESKLKVLKAIAQEYNVEWDSSNTEAEFNKKYEDLLVVGLTSPIWCFSWRNLLRSLCSFWETISFLLRLFNFMQDSFFFHLTFR